MDIINNINKAFIEAKEWTGSNGYNATSKKFYNYPDAAGIDTIGIGHRNDFDRLNGLTLQEVYNLFYADLQQAVNQLKKLIKPEVLQSLNSNQLTALVSFQFNTGVSSTALYSMINAGNYEDADKFWRTHYTTSQGQPILVKRRNAEADLFKSSVNSGNIAAVIALGFFFI